jgi:hypothetical protein
MDSIEGENINRNINHVLVKTAIIHANYETPGSTHEFQTWCISLQIFV